MYPRAFVQAPGTSEGAKFWLMIYCLFGLLTTLGYIASSIVFMAAAVTASRNFHNRIFKAVLRGSVNLFFDVQVQH